MVYVVFRDGKVARYNAGGAIAEEGQSYAIRTADTGVEKKSYLIARVPIAIVERVEFSRPCVILRAKKRPTRPTY